MSLGFAGAGYFTDLDRGAGAFYLVAMAPWALAAAGVLMLTRRLAGRG